MEQHKHFGSIMMTFFAVYTFAGLFMVLSALPVKAVEYLDEFPHEPELVNFIQSEQIDTCKDGTTITVEAYSVVKEPTLLYIEAFNSSDMENPISVMFADFSDAVLVIDIYIKNLNRIEWYRNPIEFKEAYPNGICPKGIGL